jgi:hypothetical protein
VEAMAITTKDSDGTDDLVALDFQPLPMPFTLTTYIDNYSQVGKVVTFLDFLFINRKDRFLLFEWDSQIFKILSILFFLVDKTAISSA